MANPDELLPTRESLLGRLKDWDDQESWRDFYNTYWRLIFSVALKSGLTRQEAEDVLQETVMAVARTMGGFKYDPALGSFKGWLLQLTRWRIADQFRKRQRGVIEKPSESETTAFWDHLAEETASVPEGVWDQEWSSNLFAVALENIKRRIAPRTLQIFQLSVLKEWPASRVAEALGVSRTQVYVARFRVAAHLRKEIHRLTKRCY